MPESTTTEVKPGIKTTEFWFALVAAIVSFALASGLVPDTGVWAQVVGFIGGVMTSLGYSISRGIAKKSA